MFQYFWFKLKKSILSGIILIILDKLSKGIFKLFKDCLVLLR